MAAMFGVMDLIHEKALEADISFLIEGEEEAGSRGFKDAVRRHKKLSTLITSYWSCAPPRSRQNQYLLLETSFTRHARV